MDTPIPQKWIRRACLAPVLVIALGGAAQAQAAPKEKKLPSIDYRQHEPSARVVDKAQAKARQDGKARVVLTMSMKFTPTGQLSTQGRVDQRAEIADRQAEAAQVLDKGKVIHRFKTLPLLTVTATAKEIADLAA